MPTGDRREEIVRENFVADWFFGIIGAIENSVQSAARLRERIRCGEGYASLK